MVQTLESGRIDASIDYVTMTISHESKYAETLLTRAIEIIDGMAHNHEVSDIQAMGFRGKNCNGVSAMYGATHNMIRLSGEQAQTYFFSLYCDECNITRIDLAVTHWMGEGINERIRLYQRKVERAIAEKETLTRNTALWENNQGGMTLYVGSRQSDVYVRIYNKEAESKRPEYVGAIRYEVELKNLVANKVGGLLGEMLKSLYASNEQITGIIMTTVLEQLAKRGIETGLSSDEAPISLVVPKKQTDVDAKLAWLAKSVAPTIKWLRERGWEGHVLHVLGFTDYDGNWLQLPKE